MPARERRGSDVRVEMLDSADSHTDFSDPSYALVKPTPAKWAKVRATSPPACQTAGLDPRHEQLSRGLSMGKNPYRGTSLIRNRAFGPYITTMPRALGGGAVSYEPGNRRPVEVWEAPDRLECTFNRVCASLRATR